MDRNTAECNFARVLRTVVFSRLSTFERPNFVQQISEFSLFAVVNIKETRQPALIFLTS